MIGLHVYISLQIQKVDIVANRQQTKGTKMYLQVSKIRVFIFSIHFACYFSFFRKQMPLWSKWSTALKVFVRKGRFLHS